MNENGIIEVVNREDVRENAPASVRGLVDVQNVELKALKIDEAETVRKHFYVTVVEKENGAMSLTNVIAKKEGQDSQVLLHNACRKNVDFQTTANI